MTGSISKALDFVTARREAGLSDETMLVLLVLSAGGPMTKDDIAGKSGINITTLPRYISGLVASGHLHKEKSDKDGREVLLSLSPHGQRLVESLLKHFPGDGTPAS